VTITGRIANSSDNHVAGTVIGLAVNDIAEGALGVVQRFGFMTNTVWSFVAGDRLYLNGSGPSVVVPTTGFVQRVALAVNSNTIFIALCEPIIL